MPRSEIHEGDIGTQLEVAFFDGPSAVDISTATTKNILLKKPDGTLLTKAGTFVTDGSDGRIKYTTVSGDLNADGLWRIQGHVITSTGEWKTSIDGFRVYPNL